MCEGSGSNIFLIRDGAVLTPPLSSGCLAGITRELVCEWFGAREVTLDLDDFAAADEVFLTSSTRNVHPVSRVDARVFPQARIAGRLASAFDARTMEDLDP